MQTRSTDRSLYLRPRLASPSQLYGNATAGQTCSRLTPALHDARLVMKAHRYALGRVLRDIRCHGMYDPMACFFLLGMSGMTSFLASILWLVAKESFAYQHTTVSKAARVLLRK